MTFLYWKEFSKAELHIFVVSRPIAWDWAKNKADIFTPKQTLKASLFSWISREQPKESPKSKIRLLRVPHDWRNTEEMFYFHFPLFLKALQKGKTAKDRHISESLALKVQQFEFSEGQKNKS